jgi:hypothetical protein
MIFAAGPPAAYLGIDGVLEQPKLNNRCTADLQRIAKGPRASLP